jgi:hypothetical protein
MDHGSYVSSPFLGRPVFTVPSEVGMRMRQKAVGEQSPLNRRPVSRAAGLFSDVLSLKQLFCSDRRGHYLRPLNDERETNSNQQRCFKKKKCNYGNRMLSCIGKSARMR